MASEALGLLVRANLAAGAAILLILALRTPVAQRFGARVAYAMWAIAPLAAAAALLPARTVEVVAETSPLISGALVRGATELVPAGEPLARTAEVLETAATAASLNAGGAILAIWFTGAMLALALMIWRQLQFRRSLGPLTAEAGVFRAAEPGVGPAVIGTLRPRIVLPADFETRFSPEEQMFVLDHERTHLKSGDHLVNGVVALVQCVSWFNPLVHLAAFHLRLDQELACDAQVVARHPQGRRSYAEAMLKTQISPAVLPLGCAWPARGEHPLKLRIAMLRGGPPSAARRAVGLAVVAGLGVAAAAGAWAAQPPHVTVREAAEARASAEGRAHASATAAADAQSLARIAEVRAAAAREAATEAEATRRSSNEDIDRYIPGDGTPLIIAARRSDIVEARRLLDLGADPNRKAIGDGNPLIVASAAGHWRIAELLLDRGADVNGFVLGDETPLIAAARSQNPRMVRFLVDRGADVNLAVPTGNLPGQMRSPLSVAKDPQIIAYLRAHGATR